MSKALKIYFSPKAGYKPWHSNLHQLDEKEFHEIYKIAKYHLEHHPDSFRRIEIGIGKMKAIYPLEIVFYAWGRIEELIVKLSLDIHHEYYKKLENIKE